jgi:hypothetical protein
MGSEARKDLVADQDAGRIDAQAAAGRGWWGTAVFWSFLVLVSLSWNMVEIRRGALEIACDHARTVVAHEAGPSSAGAGVEIAREHGAECVRRIRPIVLDTAWTIGAPGLAQAGQPPRVVSSAVPTAPLEAVEGKLLLVAVVSHLTLWVAGVGGVAALARRVRGASRHHGGAPGVPAASAAPGSRR